MSFNIKNSFVSRSIVQADTEQTLESDKKTSEGNQFLSIWKELI